VGLEAGDEEQEHHAQLTQRLEELGLMDEAEERRTEDGAGEQLADQRRLPERLEEGPQQMRRRKGDEDLEQDACGVLHGLAGVYAAGGVRRA